MLPRKVEAVCESMDRPTRFSVYGSIIEIKGMSSCPSIASACSHAVHHNFASIRPHCFHIVESIFKPLIRRMYSDIALPQILLSHGGNFATVVRTHPGVR